MKIILKNDNDVNRIQTLLILSGNQNTFDILALSFYIDWYTIIKESL